MLIFASSGTAAVGAVGIGAVFAVVGLAIQRRLAAGRYRATQVRTQQVVSVVCYATAVVWLVVAAADLR